MFPTKEAGDFLNAKFVTLKCELDVADPDGVAKRFGVRAYPTFIFLDADGNEFSRMLGGASDTKSFIARVTATTAPENSSALKAERFKNDPSYAMEYITSLKKNYMDNEANEALTALFAKRDIKENFNEESVKYYTENIFDLNSPIIQYMIKNASDVKAVMGEEKFNQFISSKANSKIAGTIFSRKFVRETYDKAMAEIKAVPMMHTPFYQFMSSTQDSYFAKDFNKTLKSATKLVKDVDSESRSGILSCLRLLAYEGSKLKEECKNDYLKFLELCAKAETNIQFKERYENMIKAIKDPESMKKNGSIPAMRMN